MVVTSDIRFRRWLSFALFAVLLGAQSAQAGHFHADQLLADDCLQCLVDCGQAVKPDTAKITLDSKSNFSFQLAASPAVFSNHYRLTARGPPPHSC